ncbi:hypothetical protein ACFFHJ_13555 [Planotetraspora thailandica]|nr:hypothetical protein [Planotetraspora thailandica]
MTKRLAKVVQTCSGYPSQWDAWTTDGQYLYLRYRHGVGSVERQPDQDVDSWGANPASMLREWNDGTDKGVISLEDFLTAAGLELAAGADVS